VLNLECRENEGQNFKVQISASEVMALVFWDNDEKLLVKFLKNGVTMGLEQCVQIVKKLQQRILSFRPNGELNQILILRIVPI
jgi:two-component sensor histidine kinase